MANQNFRVKTGLEVGTGVTISAGIVTATSFRGDGSALTGIAVTANVKTNSLVVTGVSTLGNTVVGGGTTQLVVIGDARITGILTIGTSSVTFDGTNNIITVGTAATINTSGFIGSGANLNSLNASNISSGTIPNARFSSSSNAYGTRTVSTSDPTGGSDGDVWYKV